jgi:hypothetical protein
LHDFNGFFRSCQFIFHDIAYFLESKFAFREFSKAIKESSKIIEGSDIVLGIKREKNNFWTKLINFLLFWRKRNNFTLKVLKNRDGDGKSYRMNIDLDEFKTEIL